MTAIVKDQFRVNNAAGFVDQFDTIPTVTDHLYATIGKSTAWADDLNPPVPTNSASEATQAWADMIGAHKVLPSDVCLVIPRIDWAASTEYFVDDATLLTPWEKETYALTSSFRVYKVATKDLSGTTYANPPLSVNEPTGTGTGITTSDGYTWDFLYDLAAYDYTALLNNLWLPVNYGDKISSLQTSSGDVNAHQTLDAKYSMIRAELLSTDFPTGIEYRQIAIVANPLLADGTTPATGTNYTSPATELTTESGLTYYIENRSPIVRTIGQNEELNMIIEF